MQTATSPENESSGDDIGVGDDLTATSPQGSEEAKLFPSATPTSFVGRASAATPTHLGDGSLLATPSFSIDSVTDPRLQMAYQVAMATKRMTPLVKEELRLSILSRRLAKGADDINVEFTQPVSHSLTPQEQEKRARRRQQNRDAAQKFREKRKLMDKSLDEEVEVLMKRRRELEAEVARLTSEKEAMLLELCPHLISQAESLVLAEVGSGEVALPGSVGSASSPQPSTSSAYPGDVTSDWSCESSPAAPANLHQSTKPSVQMPGLQSLDPQNLQNFEGTGLQYTEMQSADMSTLQYAEVPCPQYVQMQSLPDGSPYSRGGTPDVLQPLSGSSTNTASEAASVSSPMSEDDATSTGFAGYDAQLQNVHVHVESHEKHEDSALTSLPLTFLTLLNSANSHSAASFSFGGSGAERPVLMTSTARQECQDFLSGNNTVPTRPENNTREQEQFESEPSSSSHIGQSFGSMMSTSNLMQHSGVKSPAMTAAIAQGTAQESSVNTRNAFPTASKTSHKSASEDESRGNADEFSHLPKVFDPFELLTEDQDPKSSKMKSSDKNANTDPSKVRVFDTNLRDLTAVLSPSMSFDDLTKALFPHIKVMRSADAGFKDIASKKNMTVRKPTLKLSPKTANTVPQKDVPAAGLTGMSPASRLKELSVMLRESSNGNFKEELTSDPMPQSQGTPKAGTKIAAVTGKGQVETPQKWNMMSDCSTTQVASESLILQETSMAPHFMNIPLPEDLMDLQDLFSMQPQHDMKPSGDSMSFAPMVATASTFYAVPLMIQTAGSTTSVEAHLSNEMGKNKSVSMTNLSPGLSNLTLSESLLMSREVPQSTRPLENALTAPAAFDTKVNALGPSDVPYASSSVLGNSDAKDGMTHSFANLAFYTDDDRDIDPFAALPSVLMHERSDPMISGHSDKNSKDSAASAPFTSPCSSTAGSSSSQRSAMSSADGFFQPSSCADYQNSDEIWGDLPTDPQEWILDESMPKMTNCLIDYQDNVAVKEEDTRRVLSSPNRQEWDPPFQHDAAALRTEVPPAPLQSLVHQAGRGKISTAYPNLLQTSERSSIFYTSGNCSWNQSTTSDVLKSQTIPTPVSPESVFETFGPTKPQAYNVTGSVSPLRPVHWIYPASPSCALSPTRSPPMSLETVDVASLSSTDLASSGIFVHEVDNTPKPVSTSLMDLRGASASGRPVQSEAGAQFKSGGIPAPVGMLLPPERPGDPPRLLVSETVFSEH